MCGVGNDVCMARPLRLDIPDGWYHTMSRGTERRNLFLEDRDREHLLELLEKMVERYSVLLHAYVLMDNHFHLLVQTPSANLSRAMQWLNVSYSVWFNRKYNRVGPLFQGRFKAVPVDGDGSWALQASMYLHLNPIRVKSLGLDKSGRKADGQALAAVPSLNVGKARCETLRGHRWSSYLAYAGYASRPPWLMCDTLWERARRDKELPSQSYRWLVEMPLSSGDDVACSPVEHLADSLAVGSEMFISRLRALAHGDRTTQPAVRKWQRLLPFARVIAVVEFAKGEPWSRFRDRQKDSGRDIALWLGRRHCGLTLAELAAAAGGLNAVAASSALRSFERRRRKDNELGALLMRLENQLTENEI